MKLEHFLITIFIFILISNKFQFIRRRVVCFYSSWSHYRQGNANFEVENIDASLCTHILYAYLKIDDNIITQNDNTLDPPNGLDNFRKFTALKSRNTKVMGCAGGWHAGSKDFSNIALSDELRKDFSQSIVSFCLEYGFDGFDLSWQFPGQREGSRRQDKENFVLLLQELYPLMKKYNLLLSVTVGSNPYNSRFSYDIPAMAKTVDFINLITYDMTGTWTGVTGITSPLYSNTDINVDSYIKFWLEQGVPEEKLNVGIALYGRTFKLQNEKNFQIGARTLGAGDPGPHSKESGFLGFNEICRQNWTHFYDETYQSPYAYHGNQWVSFDNIQSIHEKAKFINNKNLGGAFIWSLDSDDFRGLCNKEKYPLLSALNRGLNEMNLPKFSTSNCKQDGMFRHPRNFSQFYECSKGISHVYTCPPGLQFTQNTKTCEW